VIDKKGKQFILTTEICSSTYPGRPCGKQYYE